MANNVVSFTGIKRDRELDDYDPASLDSVGATQNLRRAHADVLANEMFRIVMKTMEQSGAVDHFLEDEHTDDYLRLHNRFVLLKEALYSMYCFIDNVPHELDDVIESMFEYIGMTDHPEGETLNAIYDPKYKQQLLEMTANFKKENDS